jgi:NADPH-dependent glutamate synthase beta subunit-like oxidoreductase
MGLSEPWKFDPVKVETLLDEDKEHINDDNDSSVGSRVTILEETETEILLATSVPVVTPGSTPHCATHLVDLALGKTPKDKRSNQRKALDDCHVLISWSELQKLVNEHFVCAGCGERIVNFNRRTFCLCWMW